MVRGKKDKIDIDVDFDPESMSDLKKYQKRMEAQGLKLGGKNIRLPEKSKHDISDSESEESETDAENASIVYTSSEESSDSDEKEKETIKRKKKTKKIQKEQERKKNEKATKGSLEDTKAEIIENKNKIDKKEKSKKQKKKKENDDESDMETETVEGEELEIKKNSGKKRKAPPKDDIDFDNMTFDADLTFDQENLTIKRVKMGNIIVASGFSTGTDPSTKEEFRYPALQITRRSKAGKTWTTAIPMTMAKRLRDATNIILDANPVFN